MGGREGGGNGGGDLQNPHVRVQCTSILAEIEHNRAVWSKVCACTRRAFEEATGANYAPKGSRQSCWCCLHQSDFQAL